MLPPCTTVAQGQTKLVRVCGQAGSSAQVHASFWASKSQSWLIEAPFTEVNLFSVCQTLWCAFRSSQKRRRQAEVSRVGQGVKSEMYPSSFLKFSDCNSPSNVSAFVSASSPRTELRGRGKRHTPAPCRPDIELTSIYLWNSA